MNLALIKGGDSHSTRALTCRILEEVAKAGADAIKLQTYRPDTITLNCNNDDFKIKVRVWDRRTLYDLYEEAHTPWD